MTRCEVCDRCVVRAAMTVSDDALRGLRPLRCEVCDRCGDAALEGERSLRCVALPR